VVENKKRIFFKALSLVLCGLMICSDAAFSADEPNIESTPPTKESVQAPVTAEPAEEAIPVDPGNVTVNFKAADVRTVLAYISEVASVDIVASPEVKGLIDLKLTNKPWKTALDIIMKNYGLAYEREGDIIRVITIDKLQQEELASQAFSLNYGDAKDTVESIKQLLSNRGKVAYDARTNIVLITDIPTNIYKIGEVIGKLDKKTPQVLIEARVIETTLTNEEKLGIDWNVKITAAGAKRPITFPFDYFDIDNNLLSKFVPLVQTGASVTANLPGGQTTTAPPGLFPTGANGPGNISKGFPFVDYTQEGMTDAFKFGTLDFSEFQAILEMLKQRRDTDVVANPRIATLNNKPAVIDVGENIPMPTFERNSETGKMEITGYNVKEFFAGTILKVTPHINESGEIVVDLAPEISSQVGEKVMSVADDLRAPIMAIRKANTQVMIKDGDTIFIGGLIMEEDFTRNKKLPFIGDILGDVPYLGLLFSRKEKGKRKRELIFFITVHIMTPGKVIANSPRSDLVPDPKYTVMQKAEKNAKKKKNKWMFWQD
jgi:type IV pilus assembly protein PilQ